MKWQLLFLMGLAFLPLVWGDAVLSYGEVGDDQLMLDGFGDEEMNMFFSTLSDEGEGSGVSAETKLRVVDGDSVVEADNVMFWIIFSALVCFIFFIIWKRKKR